LISITLDELAVMRVLPALKMKLALGLPWASRMSVPVTPTEDGKQYTPGVRIIPPISVIGGNVTVQVCVTANRYALVASVWACAAIASATCIVPLTLPGPPVQGEGNPVQEGPGLTPRSPFSIVGPVLVTVAAPSTAKVPAVPREGELAAACA
jgi:hypothetical protein